MDFGVGVVCIGGVRGTSGAFDRGGVGCIAAESLCADCKAGTLTGVNVFTL